MGIENTEGTQVQNPATAGEYDAPAGDNIQAVREWGDSWKKTASEYKPTHEFVTQTFGDLENAKLAHTIYSGFTAEDFDPQNFSKVLESLSPTRAKQLVENLALEQAGQLVPKKVEELFGGQVSPEEVKLFRQWKESGYAFGEGDDLPESLKHDANGNPRSEEELEFLRGLQRQVKELSQGRMTEEQRARQEQEQAQQQAIEQEISDFGLERLGILDSEFEAIGLAPSKEDSAEASSQKEFLKKFIVHGVSGMFLADPDGAKDYNSAIGHIQRGERLLARRYESRIEKKLVDIFRSEALAGLRTALNMPDQKREARPDISNSGGSPDTSLSKPKTREEWIQSLISEGKVKV